MVLGESTEARADEGRLHLELGGSFGMLYGTAQDTYTSSDWDSEDGVSQTSRDSVSGLGPFGALDVSVGAKLGEHVALGGYLQLGLATRPALFTGDPSGSWSVALGPQLELTQAAHRGWFVRARIGGAEVDRDWGLGGGAGVGYAFRLAESWRLGVGGSCDLLWSWSTEEGDFGTYHFAHRAIMPGLFVLLRFV